MRFSVLSLFCALALAPLAAQAETQLERGQYLVTIAGCSDCHTPGGLLGTPDKARMFGGSDVGFGDPASGVWIGQNITPDMETGIGAWSAGQIVDAITRGVRPDGRKLSEIMPWPTFAHLTPEDAQAVAAYLKSLPPVKNKVSGPTGPNDDPAVPYVSVTLPVAQYLALPKPK
jgi:mono/diheme cytochrome c family protein